MLTEWFWTVLDTLQNNTCLQGLVAGFIGTGPALTLLGLAVAALFLMLWINALIVAEWP